LLLQLVRESTVVVLFHSGLLGVAAVMLSCGFCSELLALNFMPAELQARQHRSQWAE
jgi:hypothetical protein